MSGNVALRNKQLDDYGAAMATASMVIYSGSVPASADAALSGNTALATHTLTGWAAASSGSKTANAVANATIAADGTATFCRLTAGSYVEQLLVGTSGTPVIVNTTSYTSGGTSQVTSIVISKS